jgi:hypothetical protein
MADYHPLIAREVAALDMSTGDGRGALYERARATLIELLRSVRPALDESQITSERLSLEEAIRKVEGEVVRQSRARGKTTGVKARTVPPRVESAPNDPVDELAKLTGGPPSRR